MKKWQTTDMLIFSIIWATLLIVAVIVILYIKGVSPKLNGIMQSLPTESRQAQTADTVSGAVFDYIAFDPNVLEGQKPGEAVPQEQIERLLDSVAQYAGGIRTYGMGDGIDGAIEYAHAKGLNTIAGIWLSADTAANEAEMELADTLEASGAIDILCVGNECLLRGDMTEAELLDYIARAREMAGKDTLIAYADTPENYSDNLLRAVDVALPNIHPYWAGLLAQEGAAYVNETVRALSARASTVNPKLTVIVGETGFPNTEADWAQFWENYLTSDKAAPSVAFMMADCPWKAESGIDIEGHWGLLDVSSDFTLVPKPEINALLRRDLK